MRVCSWLRARQAHSSLPPTYYLLLLATYCSLVTAYYLTRTGSSDAVLSTLYSLLTTHYLLLATCSLRDRQALYSLLSTLYLLLARTLYLLLATHR